MRTLFGELLSGTGGRQFAHSEIVPRKSPSPLYTVTAAGREAFHAFTRHQPKPIAIRDDLLVMAQGLEAGEALTIRDAVAKQTHWASEKLAVLQRLQERMLASRS